MSGILIFLSVASTILFALVVLTKLGVPVIFSAALALLAGYVWWQYERADADNEKPGLADGLVALMDAKDIVKYFNKLF